MKAIIFNFEVIKNIYGLPLYQGAYFYALFKKLFKELNIDTFIQNYNLLPFTLSATSFFENENFDLIFILKNYNDYENLIKIAENFNNLNFNDKFSPSTIRLKNFILLDESYFERLIENSIQKILNSDGVTIKFITPLRFKRPDKYSRKLHKFIDPNFFFDNPSENIAFLFDLNFFQFDYNSNIVNFSDYSGLWVDIQYGDNSKTMGGFIGQLNLRYKINENFALKLVKSQLNGIGKSRNFGYGNFIFLGFDDIFNVLYKSKEIFLKRIYNEEYLLKAFDNLKHSAPGIDNITVNEVESVKYDFIENISYDLKNNNYKFNKHKIINVKKDDGGIRKLNISTVSDRIVEKSVSINMENPINKVLSIAAYAYRKNKSIKQSLKVLQKALKNSYNYGFKADIKGFFDNIDRDILIGILHSLFAEENFIKFFRDWFSFLDKEKIDGVPQGSPISPVLSNLYLDFFDKEMLLEDVYFIRYGDDFILLSKNEENAKRIYFKAKTILQKLSLEINENKVKFFQNKEAIEFLGHLTNENESIKIDKNKNEAWGDLYSSDFVDGIPIYITKTNIGAYSEGNNLVLKDNVNKKEIVDKIPWKAISDINIVGRSYFSNGVIFRALYNKIPIHIINIQGKYIGTIISDFYKISDVQDNQKKFLENSEAILEFSKEIISAKINNSYVLLKRNHIDDKYLKIAREKALNAKNLEQLRGIEGSSAKIFFKYMKELVEPFEFNGRHYYPPTDEVNALLSFAYTLIYNRTASMLIKNGFNPYLGFFHKKRGEHFALASDLMEELRHIGDRIVLSLIHKREIRKEHFDKKEKNGKLFIHLNSEGYPIFIKKFEETFKKKSSYSGKLLSLYEYLDEIGGKVKKMMKLNVSYKALRIR